MNENKLIVKLPKNLLYRSERYLIRIKGFGEKWVSYKSNKVEFDLPMGVYMVEVENHYHITIQKVVLTLGQRKTLRVTPNALEVYTLPIILSFFIAFLVMQAVSRDMGYYWLAVLCLVPLLLLKPKRGSKKFTVTA